MNTVEDLSHVANQTIPTTEFHIDDPTFFDANRDTLVPITRLSTDPVR